MSFLKVNGIEVPVADGSASEEQEVIGSNERAVDASSLVHRRAIKGRWTFETALRPAATAIAFRKLLQGLGHVWSFESTVYSSKGLGPSTLGGLVVSSTTAVWGSKSGKIAAAGSDSVFGNVWPSNSPYTVAFWNKDGAGAWTHYVLTSTPACWVSGVAGADPGVLTPDSSGFTLEKHATNDRYWDDIIALPYVVPDDWPGQMYAFTSPWAGLPRLYASGDFLEDDGGTKTVVGAVDGLVSVQGYYGGSFHDNLQRLAGKLEEA